MSDSDKKKMNTHRELLKHRKKEKDKELLDDLEFISEETVKDKSKMAEAKPGEEKLASRKKTVRRSVDEFENRKERSVAMARKNLPFIGIGCLVVVLIIGGSVYAVRNHRAKLAAANKNKAVSEQQYEVDEHQDINDLIGNYYTAYAAGDTDALQKYAYPLSDSEQSYVKAYSKYIEKYENVTCYTKSGADAKSYIVSVAYALKFKNVTTAAPGLDFFYVRTDKDGNVYIDNTYSTYNLSHKENQLDTNIQKLITDYQAGEDVVALQASVQTQYDTAVSKDAALKKMVNETLVAAMNQWKADQESQQQKKTQQAKQDVQKNNSTNNTQTTAKTDTAKTDTTKTNTKKVTESKKGGTVYIKQNVRVRKKASSKSKMLDTLITGLDVKRLAVTSNGWTKIQNGKVVGYVKSEYISEKKVKKAKKTTTKKKTKTLATGKKVTLKNTVNVRKSMSESSERVGVAYKGDTVKVIMSYDDGWTKVSWGDQSGYIRTDVLH